MKVIKAIIVSLLFVNASFSQNYSLVTCIPSEPEANIHLILNTLEVDHFHQTMDGIQFVTEDENLAVLDSLGVPYRIDQNHLSEYYERQLMEDQSHQSQRSACGLSHFQPGTMAGYHTWQEAVDQLDSMHARYPSIISPKHQIGTSVEGRPIWAVKISDNPLTDESGIEPGVYLDALTHAREPLSLEMCLYYMWWLLEKYGNNPEATYLINNREIFIVPVMNPDGYVFNQMTNPNGGGLWRKNRRSGTSGCLGIDLNRNFGFGWGSNSGSNSDPCSNTFRGSAAFSEPETQAIQNLLATAQPEIAFSIHSFGQKFLSPLGYVDSLVNFDIYADFSSEFIPENYSGYGTVKQMLNYTSSGTTRDYFHSQGIYGWTPEVGESFWDAPSTICSRVREFMPALKYITWAAGAYSRIHDIDYPELVPGQTSNISIRIKNKGLSQFANSVSVGVVPLSPGIQAVSAVTAIGNIPPRQMASKSFNLAISPNVQPLDTIRLKVVVSQDGIISDVDTVTMIAGARTTIFQDGFEAGMTNWQTGGTGYHWDTTRVDQAGGSTCMSDSRLGNYHYDATPYIALIPEIDLTQTVNPVLEFNAKWSLEPGLDFVVVEVKPADATDWKRVGGRFANRLGNNAYYSGNQHWIRERIDLKEFAGKKIRLRLGLRAGLFVQSDGFYLDDLQIVDYQASPTAIPSDKLDFGVRVFPNPSEGLFSLQISSQSAEEILTDIYDASGRRINELSKSIRGPGEHSLRLDLRSHPEGVYLMRIVSAQGTMTKYLLVR